MSTQALFVLFAVRQGEPSDDAELARLAVEAAELQLRGTPWHLTSDPLPVTLSDDVPEWFPSEGTDGYQFKFETDRPKP